MTTSDDGKGRTTWARIAGGGALLVLTLLACSDDDSGAAAEDTRGACDAIASACHDYDEGQGIGHDCHELGHEGDDATCAPRRAECLAACPPKPKARDAGEVPPLPLVDGGGGADAAVDAIAVVCAEHCACMATTCATYPGYPFADDAACTAACRALSEEERTCFPKWCTRAKVTPSKHTCEHAWGAVGLAECDSL